MDFSILANGYRDEIIEKTKGLVSIPSIEGEPQEGMPMGKDVNRALVYTLDLCKELGFRIKNVDGYAGYAEYGSGEEMVGILCHLDVVPAGEGWTKPPFSATLEGDQIFGRGTSDNKGPTISAIYALKAVAEAGVPLKRRVRLIFGTNEESGWRGINYYRLHEEKPTMAFVPDAMYPVINVEKGIVHVHLTHGGAPSRSSADSQLLRVLQLEGGHRANMIPRICVCKLAGDTVALEKAATIARGLEQDPYPKVDATIEAGELTLTVEGLAGHGSTPAAGVNAVSHMIKALEGVLDAGFAFDSQAITQVVGFLSSHVGLETNGKSLGIDYQDTVSGELTLNVGTLGYTDGEVKVAFDIRYPVTKALTEILDPIEKAGTSYGFALTQGHSNRPLHVPEDSFLVQQLLKVYEKHTGEKARPLSIGGGTYARAFDNAVAFGSTMPGEQRNVHREDEFTTVTELVRNTAIFADAISLLAGE
ncbi:MAG: dipeptidase PepV [Firmicutes bacterium]|nr:dipeptidase PepV [Bacillota bacterium]